MPYVSLIVEFLRARPAAVFWLAALAQTALWIALPALFYTSPPGSLAETLAIGQAHALGSWRGPPLAFWLADLAFRSADGHIVSVYALSQLCVLIALWAVFALGRAMMGAQHAAIAALLMCGILVLSAPTPEFGPAVLALPLTALCLLFYWRALGEEKRSAWIALGVTLGLLLLTSYWGLLLATLLAAFTLATRVGRAALASIDPWAAAALALVIPFPHFVWLLRDGGWARVLEAYPTSGWDGRAASLPLVLGGLAISHAGLALLVLLASGWQSASRGHVPEVERAGTAPLARPFVLFFALAMPLSGALAMALSNGAAATALSAPLILMSGMLVVMLAGERIALYRQHIVGVTWVAVLLTPPLAVVAAFMTVPWTGVLEFSSRQPTAAMARFFAETYQRRIGAPPAIVVGELRLAYALATALPGRPMVFDAATPARTPWLRDGDVRGRGAIAVWPLDDPTGAAPADIRARFPDLVPEVPQSFPRPVEGVQPALRVGWGMIRPQYAAARASPIRLD